MEVSKKNIAQYTLRSKDVPLISFSLYELEEEAFGLKNKVYSVQIDKIFLENQALFPKNLSINLSNDELLRWINRRKAPKNRQFVEKILAAFDDRGVCQNLWLVLYHLCGCRYHVFVVSLCQILWSLLSRFVVLRW